MLETGEEMEIGREKKAKFGGRIKITDKNLCVGCRNCELVCSLFHEGVCSSSLARIYVSKDLFTGDYEQYTCAQCVKPKCLPACPIEGALSIDPKTSAKYIDKELCIGCGACERACIFSSSVSRIRYDKKRNICIKCDLCGGEPQCVEVCPVSILVYEVSA